MNRPQPEEYAPFYSNYIDSVTDNVIDQLARQARELPAFLESIPDEKAAHAYAPGKWTVKELLGHLIDTERIMTYRALCIARGETISLPGFDENAYVENSGYKSQDFRKLIAEFRVLREANLYLFRSFGEEELSKTGTANNYNISVRALLFIIAGHINHHRKIITERYL